LALGLITSPILADLALRRVDSRIGAACRRAGLVFTRYVDDITISGPFDLSRSGFEAVVLRILSEDGFQANCSKSQFGELSKSIAITNIRILRGHLDVRREYADELDRLLENSRRLANGGKTDGPYLTQTQIRGRLQFVCWVNPGRRRQLMRKYRSICWRRVARAALEQGLVAMKKTLHRA
jgi:hypothetical protein